MEEQALKQMKIAVLMGGVAAEREVSLRSGAAVTQALQQAGFLAQGIDVQSLSDLQALQGECDVAFLALHGRWGEDGTVQAILHDLQIPYTGSGLSASAIGMDKLRTKWMWLGAGLPTPKFQWVSAQRPLDENQFDVPFPVMVKPTHEGSSIGMRKVYDWAALVEAVAYAQQFDEEVLIEQWVTGREFTAAVLGHEALPLIELKTSHDFYDYEAKYQANDTQYLCPVALAQGQEAQLQNMVLEAFKVIGCQGWGRVDFMLDDDQQPWLIEINTAPGMTDHSLVPMAARQSGRSFEMLVVEILKQALA